MGLQEKSKGSQDKWQVSTEEDKKNVAQNIYSCMSQIVAFVPSRQEKWTSLVSSVTDYHWNFIWLYLICYCSVLQYLEVVMRCGYYCYFFCFSWHWCGFDVWFLRPFNSLLEISVFLSTPASRRSLNTSSHIEVIRLELRTNHRKCFGTRDEARQIKGARWGWFLSAGGAPHLTWWMKGFTSTKTELVIVETMKRQTFILFLLEFEWSVFDNWWELKHS